MSDQNAHVTKHLKSAKEHAAGIKAAQAWVQELMAAGLLRTQNPIRDQPITEDPKS